MSRSLQLAVLAALVSVTWSMTSADVVGHPDPLSQLQSEDPTLAANKRLVFDLWRGIVNAGHVELADELLAEGYIQHSPVLPTGRAAFKQIFSVVPRRDVVPELVEPPLVAIVAEGPLVVMALVERLQDPEGSGPYTSTHFNLFRVEDGRLAEHWHSVQTEPGPDVAPPDEGGPKPVTGRVGAEQIALLAADDPQLAANKRLVFDAWREIVDAGQGRMTGLYLAEEFVGHNPNMPPGRDGFRSYFGAADERGIETSLADPLVAVVAEGDLVVQVRMHEHAHPVREGEQYTTTWFDMFRVSDGRLAEHWDPAVMGQAAPSASDRSEPTSAVPVADCPAEASIAYICGLANAEDLVRIGTQPWLIASSLNRGDSLSPGRLYLIHSQNRTAEDLFAGEAPARRHDTAMFPGCSSFDADAFDTHGLAIVETSTDLYRLYVTSHGAAEAIQVFEIDASGSRPTAAWVGCVPLPEELWANSVAILDDGGFVATQFMDPTDSDSIARILRGELNGVVYEWHPGGQVQPPDTAVSGPNGIEVSADERYMFVAAFGGRRVIRFDRGPDPQPPVSVDVPIRADNLRWSERGTLLTAGGNAAPGTGWTVYEVDPDDMTAAPLTSVSETAALQDASTALQVGDEIWVGTPGGDRVGYLPMP